MDWLSFCYALLFLVITPFALQSNNKENTENLIKLYMLYDLTNNLPKELEIINKIKNFDLEQYYLLITKYYLKIKKYKEANDFLNKINKKKIKNQKIKNEIISLKLRINEDTINEEEIKKILNNEKNIDVKIIYQIFSLIKFKNKKLATKIKNLILTNYPKSIYSYKIKRNE
ncbi:hypothetical protein [Borreliella afzelii]|uniref:Tetratricopeptide repeat domain protein n=2 Tax=Borreliella afzelii TaxID=29518 RepID=G0IQL7_BORAP|nr:hypothetical protein [Borreliella afzelii]AEL70042.1 conserved hypothetical protein [Borreliella afzelii PKo]AJY72796.1 hypothetical protein BAFK78_838 [Borreliella afzelii K78]EEC21008.1 conserved hypothetical protein [Borreliella afzelii ACA-1]AIK19109.1 hypothetical protein P612_04260 [Borreliella afzelii Tom3107]MBB5140637.1 hypothetical protein [Borreliella afzelii]